MIDKNSPIPIYYQLEEEIKRLIEEGVLQPGDMIPSEREYSEKFNISRMTVRQAINNLVKDGYLVRHRGKGTFVAEEKLEQKLQGLTSFTEDMQARGLVPSTRLLEFSLTDPPVDVRNQLQLESAEKVYKMERVRLADGIPMALESSYVPQRILGEVGEEIVKQSLYQYIEHTLKLDIGQATQVLEASVARKRESEILEIKEGAPVLLMKRYTRLKNGQPFEVVKSIYRADRYKFIINIHR